ncbi:hypothetical protein [Lewinella sp. W8]|uniref:hypothetical protein n=1 Tax=Lewinella sp. W8 TaxID=2528208 RepID=UPI001C12A5E4|nr:hypothetical protein [Lewinella sp. W8]
MLRLYALLTILAFFSCSLSLSAQCPGTVVVAPTAASFENGMDGYLNVAENYGNYTNLDFLIGSGASAFDGPSAAADGNNYLYVPFRYSGPPTDPYQIAELRSPCFDLTGLNDPELHVRFFQANNARSSIFLMVSRDGGLTWEYPPAPGEYVRYQAPANRPPGWFDGFVDLSPYAAETDFRFRIGVQASAELDMDFAFDLFTIDEKRCPVPVELDLVSTTTSGAADGEIDVIISGGVAPYTYAWSNGATGATATGLSSGNYSVTVTDVNGCFGVASVYVSDPLACNGTKGGGWPYSYDFESNGLGLLKQNRDDDTNWRRLTGDTPTTGTGPQSFIPFPAGPQYRYIEAGNGNNPRTGVLTVKKCLNMTSLTQPIVQVAYNMYGIHQGSFAIEVSDDGGQSWERAFEDTGNNGFIWSYATVDLSPYNSGQTRVRIVGETGGTGPESDIAIDYFYLGEAGGSLQAERPQEEIVAVNQLEQRVESLKDQWMAEGHTPAFGDVVIEDNQNLPLPAAAAEGCATCVLDTDIFKIYPNPATAGKEVTVSFTSPGGGVVTMILLRIDGQPLVEVARRVIRGPNEVNFMIPADLPPGIYHLRVVGADFSDGSNIVVVWPT